MLAQVGCATDPFDAQLGPPFSCSDGLCPEGYRCAQALCVANGAADPPLTVATCGLEDAPPQLFWDGVSFSAIWQQLGATAGPGVYLAKLQVGTLGVPRQLAATSVPVNFTAVYEPMSGRHVVAIAQNDLIGNGLRVLSVGASDATPVVHSARTEPYTPLGYSHPSLATRRDGTVTLAFTLGAPPQVIADNVFCERISLLGGPTDTACGPSAKNTRGLFASEVTVAEYPKGTLLSWRAGTTFLTFRGLTGIELPPLPLAEVVHTEKMINVTDVVGSAAMIAQVSIDRGDPRWALALVGPERTQRFDSATFLSSPGVVPDVDGGAGAFFVCRGDEDGGASILRFVPDSTTTNGLRQEGAARPIPRYSHAPVERCRIVAAPESGQLGVLWRERLPPATARIYFTTMPIGP